MLSSITLKFTESEDITLPCTGVTIFVGPNNSGKSLVLKELEQAYQTPSPPTNYKVLDDFDVVWPDQSGLELIISQAKTRTPSDRLDLITFDRVQPGGGRHVQNLFLNMFNNVLGNRSDKYWFSSQVDRWGMLRLDGRSRFNLTNDQQGGDLLALPGNMLAHFFQDDVSRRKVRSLIYDAFGLYFCIDPTNLGNLRIKLASEAPSEDEQSLNQAAREFYKDALHIKDASDGVQAFTGIMTAILSGEFHTLLIDEPEAFLHPPLARKLGNQLATIVAERGGALLASTHSSDFLMGCVQAAPEVRVVRLEYNKGKSRGKLVDSENLKAFLKRPLMRAANVIAGLFYDGVVVTESDNDRVFYSEIYYRLSEVSAGLPALLFVHAQNKQTMKDIVGPLRQFGVPAAAIPDIDILKDGGNTWSDWLSAANIPDALHLGFGQQRSSVRQLFTESGEDMNRDGGTAILSKNGRLAADQLFDLLDEYGVFTVRRGELENWLPNLEVQGKKTDWTVAMLERLGSDPVVDGYIQPSDGDVWDFIRSVVRWIQNPARKGM